MKENLQEKKDSKALFWVSFLYYGQGLPYGVVMLMAPIYFVSKGISLEGIGLLSLLGLPWTLKLFWSPLVDLVGKRRNWVTNSLFLLFFAFTALAVFAENNWGGVHISIVGQMPLSLIVATGFLFLIAFFSATADIAQDAFYMDELSVGQQALFIGPRVTAYRLAMVTASGLLVFLAGIFNWRLGFILAAVLMGVIAFGAKKILPHPETKKPPYKTAGEFFRQFKNAFVSYLSREKPIVLLAFILTYKLGEQMLGRMTVPFFQYECGVNTWQMGIISGVFGVGATILGAIAASIWIARKGLWFALVSITITMNSTDILYIGLVRMNSPGIELIAAVHGVESFSLGLGTAAFAYLLMRTCKDEFRAGHYAMATGIMALGGTIAGATSGFLATHLGYEDYFILCLILSIPGIILLFALPKNLTGREDDRPHPQPLSQR